jgi:hypothetical protein
MPANGDRAYEPGTHLSPRIEWGVRCDLEGPGAPIFTLFKRTSGAYQAIARWKDFGPSGMSESVLFDIVAAWTQRLSDDLVMSKGVQLVLPSET